MQNADNKEKCDFIDPFDEFFATCEHATEEELQKDRQERKAIIEATKILMKENNPYPDPEDDFKNN